MKKKILVFCLLAFCFCFCSLLTPLSVSAASVDPGSASDLSLGLYDSAFQLFHQYIYGSSAVLTPDQTLTLTFLSTLAALFVVSLPFLLVFFILRLIFR